MKNIHFKSFVGLSISTLQHIDYTELIYFSCCKLIKIFFQILILKYKLPSIYQFIIKRKYIVIKGPPQSVSNKIKYVSVLNK